MEKKKSNRNPFVSIALFLFPFIPNCVANKKLRAKLDNIGEQLPYDSEDSVLSGFKSPKNIDTKILEDMINENRHRMERLEDKAKIQIAGITIAISIIVGITGSLPDIVHESVCLQWIVYVLLVASVIYMVCSGLFAFHLLTDKNVFYYLPNNISEMEDETKIKAYNAVIAKNQLQNMIRNNEISTSYAFMRNAIALLIIVFAIWNIPIA